MGFNQKAFKQINQKRSKPWAGKEEVRLAWIQAIEAETGLHLNAERGRKDASLNHVIVEFKAPGLFCETQESPKFREAEQQLLRYIQKESLLTGIPESDYIGIAIDGEHVCFAQVVGGKFSLNNLSHSQSMP